MRGRTFVYETLIRESHLDGFGHVNNAKYLELLEEARWEFITANGYGLAEVQRDRRGPVVLEIHLRLRKELRLRESIRIESHVARGGSKVFRLRQEIKNAAGDLCAEADFTFGILDLEKRRLASPTPAWLKAFGVDEVDSPSKS